MEKLVVITTYTVRGLGTIDTGTSAHNEFNLTSNEAFCRGYLKHHEYHEWRRLTGNVLNTYNIHITTPHT